MHSEKLSTPFLDLQSDDQQHYLHYQESPSLQEMMGSNFVPQTSRLASI
jgi:hypothetical protein